MTTMDSSNERSTDATERKEYQSPAMLRVSGGDEAEMGVGIGALVVWVIGIGIGWGWGWSEA